MLDCVVWRVVALATPPWERACMRCSVSNARFEVTDRFRVNAHQGRLDVWLLYACERCGAVEKRKLLHRTAVAAIEPASLDGYHRNDATLARRHAFEMPVRDELAHRVERPPLAAGNAFALRIEQPEPCGVRWDRLFARELGRSRSAIAAAWRRGAIALDGARSLHDRVIDGHRARVKLESDPNSTVGATLRRCMDPTSDPPTASRTRPARISVSIDTTPSTGIRGDPTRSPRRRAKRSRSSSRSAIAPATGAT